jgi:hypothetical protein
VLVQIVSADLAYQSVTVLWSLKRDEGEERGEIRERGREKRRGREGGRKGGREGGQATNTSEPILL